MKTLICFAVVVSCSWGLRAQEFQKVYGSINSESAEAIIPTDDGNIMVFGYYRGFSFFPHTPKPVLIKMTTEGDTLWTRDYFFTGANDVYTDIVQLSDGGYVAMGSGYWSGGFSNIHMFKTDALGNVEWIRGVRGEDGYDETTRIIATSDGGFALCGRSSSNSGSAAFDFFVSKFLADGTMEWAKTYNAGLGAEDIVETTDGNLMVTGLRIWSLGDETVLLKLDMSGNILWIQSYSLGTGSEPKALVAMPDGGVVVGASSGNSAIQHSAIMRVDDLGNVDWAVKYNTLDAFATYIKSIDLLDDGTIVAGMDVWYQPTISHRLGFLRVDTAGNLLNNRTYGGSGMEALTGFSADGNHALMCGFTESTGLGNSEMIVLRVDSTGISNNCEVGSYNVAPFNLFPINSSFSVVDSGGFTLDTMTLISSIPAPLVHTDQNMSISVSPQDVGCFGQANGQASASVVNNGQSPYNYAWSSGDSTQVVSGLDTGSYNITVFGADGVCWATDSFTIIQPTVLTSTMNQTDATCSGSGDGTATVNPSGGTPPYIYTWSNAQTTQTAIGLYAGAYSVNVIDANGCLGSNGILVSEPPSIMSTPTVTNTYCGESVGTIELSTTGGTAPYQYLWGSGADSSFVDFLAAGYHNVTITDANGCNVLDSMEVIVDIDPIEICMITVDSTSQYNTVVWEKPAANHIAGFKIYRNMLGSYSPVGYVEYDSLSQFTDQSFGIDPNQTSYRYKITALDSCGNESVMSAYHETMHVTANLGVGSVVNLLWDDYEGVPYTFYRILRDSTGNQDWEILDSVPNTNFTYTDANPPSNATYAVEVILPSTCTSTRANHNTTRSNRSSPIGGPMGIGEESSISLETYPNPSNGVFNVRIGLENGGSGMLRVLSISGARIHEQMLNLAPGPQVIPMSLEHVATGSYILEVQIDGERTQQRLIIGH